MSTKLNEMSLKKSEIKSVFLIVPHITQQILKSVLLNAINFVYIET